MNPDICDDLERAKRIKYLVLRKSIEKKNWVDRVTSESRHMGCFGERKEVFEVCLMLLTGRQSINTRVGLIRSVQLQTGFENFFTELQDFRPDLAFKIWRNREDTNCWRLIAFCPQFPLLLLCSVPMGIKWGELTSEGRLNFPSAHSTHVPSTTSELSLSWAFD